MAREKVILHQDPLRVEYTRERMDTLRELRETAARILDGLGRGGVYGSVARGDVRRGSDVDIILLEPGPAYSIELALTGAGFQISHREVVMASPNSPVKAHIHLGEGRTVSFALQPLKRREEEFYRFGGYLGAQELRDDIRVPGVDKRLLLIEPAGDGHVESGIAGREAEVARVLGIGKDAVDERVRVLTRRDSVGRTGVYLRQTLGPDESFEQVFRRLASSDSSVKRQCRQR